MHCTTQMQTHQWRRNRVGHVGQWPTHFFYCVGLAHTLLVLIFSACHHSRRGQPPTHNINVKKKGSHQKKKNMCRIPPPPPPPPIDFLTFLVFRTGPLTFKIVPPLLRHTLYGRTDRVSQAERLAGQSQCKNFPLAKLTVLPLTGSNLLGSSQFTQIYISWYFCNFWADFCQTNFMSSCRMIHFIKSDNQFPFIWQNN